jgi:putative metallohydrolase (TIGR04338 family)
VRDTQRQRLYDAEQQVGGQLAFAAAGARTVTVGGSTLTLPLEVRFGTLAAAQAYLRAVQGSTAFADRFPRAARVPLTVRRRAGARAAHYEAPATIALHDGSPWLRELIVLHELVHHGQYHDLPPGAPHGAAFAGAMLALVHDVMGPEVALLLTVAFAEHGVAVATVVGAPR